MVLCEKYLKKNNKNKNNNKNSSSNNNKTRLQVIHKYHDNVSFMIG
jgi:hypothetical protein